MIHTCKFKLTLLIVIPVGLFLSSCDDEDDDNDNQDIMTETYDLEDFDELELSGSGTVYIDSTINDDIQITGDEDYVVGFDITVENNRLSIATNQNADIYLDNRDYTWISLTGSTDLIGDTIFSDHLQIEMTGNSEIDLPVYADNSIELSVSGDPQAYLKGNSQRVSITSDGSSYADTHLIEADSAFVVVSGDGLIDVYASDYLSVVHNGSGNVRYWGSPIETDIEITGSGEVIDME